MNDLELKNLLLQTHPVLPGQEARAWSALQGRLFPSPVPRTGWSFLPGWRALTCTGVALLVAVGIFDLGAMMHPSRHALVFADSQSPGIYATGFYSHSAQAQVVWLNGMEPVSDQPTYLDPTSVIARNPDEKAHAAPDSL